MKTVLVGASYGPNDPPTQNTCRFFAGQGWRVILVVPTAILSSYVSIENASQVYYVDAAPRLGRFGSFYEFLSWGRVLRRAARESRADLFISFMFHPWVAAGAMGGVKRTACIYDIPPARHAGLFSRHVFRRGWRDLHTLDLVWSSDPLKARFCEEKGKLPTVPPVCYNVPYSDYILDSQPGSERNWLCERLTTQGVRAGDDRKILLRAGAFGPLGGIEETLQALVVNPRWNFVLMGRPDAAYEAHIRQQARILGLADRVGFLIRPSNDDWRKALLGADAGHLIHLRPEGGYHREAFDNNSCLSTNRLFQYMAAALPILSYGDPRMDGIHREVDCFAVIHPQNLIESISRELARLGSDTAEGLRRGANGRRGHLTVYHWEAQFAPIYRSLERLFIS